ncbi:hypothetical protein FPQ18DRAFT_334755 [Pyronema domesticum]|nr:hypothetical protein FPQ18DRAFT_334755 [Pyronema domesticum]
MCRLRSLHLQKPRNRVILPRLTAFHTLQRLQPLLLLFLLHLLLAHLSRSKLLQPRLHPLLLLRLLFLNMCLLWALYRTLSIPLLVLLFLSSIPVTLPIRNLPPIIPLPEVTLLPSLIFLIFLSLYPPLCLSIIITNHNPYHDLEKNPKTYYTPITIAMICIILLELTTTTGAFLLAMTTPSAVAAWRRSRSSVAPGGEDCKHFRIVRALDMKVGVIVSA